MSDSRRNFLKKTGLVGAGLLASKTIASAQHETHVPAKPPQVQPQKDSAPGPSGGNVLVQTPDVPKLPWTLENGVKVFRLTAEVVKTWINPMREIYAWGYNGSVPGPTIEVNEGDRVRIHFENKLPEATTVHWHGLEVPLKMDGVP
ncbi:MAG: multicopper oxidase domain-containing protein, partial [Pyrinomonadaceae bacterium]